MDNCVIFVVLCIVLVFSSAAPILEKNINKSVGEYGRHFEGDIVLTKAQREAITSAMISEGGNRNGLTDIATRWPNKTVVYHINYDDFDEEQVQKIEYAIADIASKSCLKFKKREREDEHAIIVQGTANGCFSNVGFNTPDDEGEVHQVLNLAKGCFKHGTIVHEMMHSLGFYHMQSTYDRDEFITIVWENIQPGTEHNFAKYSNNTVTDFGVPYDYGSVMHYSEKAFSKNGNRTIIPLQENVTIGQREELSDSDILKLNRMYCEHNEYHTEQPVKSDGHDKEIIVDHELSQADDTCFAHLGYSPSDQPELTQSMNLGTECFGHGVIIHEMLHSIGFYHMQNTYDRDDYVKIMWENIEEENKYNFLKYDSKTVTSFGVPYDYHSVLHYDDMGFSKNGKKTIIPLKAGVHIGQRIGLSKGDIVKLNKMYNCEERGVQEAITNECECDISLFGICFRFLLW